MFSDSAPKKLSSDDQATVLSLTQTAEKIGNVQKLLTPTKLLKYSISFRSPQDLRRTYNCEIQCPREPFVGDGQVKSFTSNSPVQPDHVGKFQFS